jgi:sialic acid synthase SpsE
MQQVDLAVSCIHHPFILLHAIGEYPMQQENANLKVMDWLRERYHCPVGYSGHEMWLEPTIAAVARGACVIERHFTVDKDLWGTDQSMSLDPPAMAELVSQIRKTEMILGSPEKAIYPFEFDSIKRLRQGPRHEAV